jgi:guanosine-diphosphatase
MRRTSVSLPTKQVAHDPFEKPDRYASGSHTGGSLFSRMKESWMSQSQKMRWIKTSAIIFSLIVLFYLFAPSGVEVVTGGISIGLITKRTLMP